MRVGVRLGPFYMSTSTRRRRRRGGGGGLSGLVLLSALLIGFVIYFWYISVPIIAVMLALAAWVKIRGRKQGIAATRTAVAAKTAQPALLDNAPSTATPTDSVSRRYQVRFIGSTDDEHPEGPVTLVARHSGGDMVLGVFPDEVHALAAKAVAAKAMAGKFPSLDQALVAGRDAIAEWSSRTLAE